MGGMKHIAWLAIFCAGIVQAQTQLTIYNQNFATVKESRSFDLKKGDNEVRVSDITAHLEPASVVLRDLKSPDGIQINIRRHCLHTRRAILDHDAFKPFRPQRAKAILRAIIPAAKPLFNLLHELGYVAHPAQQSLTNGLINLPAFLQALFDQFRHNTFLPIERIDSFN